MWSPKKRFLTDDPTIAKAHADLANSHPFQVAAEAALLQMIADLPDTTDQVAAIAGYHRIIGARSYLRSLWNIATPGKEPERKPNPDNLNHHA